jgi:hypothetical protein
MDVETLSSLLSWLVKNKWGLSFLLAVSSFFCLVLAAVDHPGWQRQLDYYFIQGPVFRVGVYVGSLFYRDDAMQGVFGAAADVLALMGIWFVVIWLIDRFRARK